jgi:uncharacterized protein (TIGR01777 family)
MAKILITGGSGLVGTAISELLLKKGDEPLWLSRKPGRKNGIRSFEWDISKNYIDPRAFENVESVIHLAGSGIMDKRWTKDYKQKILSSRIKTSELLFEQISTNNYPVKTFIGSSAVGYYGAITSDHVFTENDPPGDDFLARICVDWEKSYLPFTHSGMRTVVLRLGVILAAQGGALPKMAAPFKFGFGAALGKGDQHFPWIHIHDIAAVFVHALLNKTMKGTYNSTATEFVTNHNFSKELAKSLSKPFFLPSVPEFVLRLFLGERATTLTTGLKVSNQKLKDSGFEFEFETLAKALTDTLGN